MKFLNNALSISKKGLTEEKTMKQKSSRDDPASAVRLPVWI
jgi:hypothetical protein